MPYTAKQEKTFQAVAHGWKPKKGSLKKLSAGRAKAMLEESKGETSQQRAFKRRKKKRAK